MTLLLKTLALASPAPPCGALIDDGARILKHIYDKYNEKKTRRRMTMQSICVYPRSSAVKNSLSQAVFCMFDKINTLGQVIFNNKLVRTPEVRSLYPNNNSIHQS